MNERLGKVIVAVGSKNLNKVNPTRAIFAKHYPNLEVIGVSVESGVSEQPMTDQEASQGALNRASNALKVVLHADFSVGIEGSLVEYPWGWMERTWVTILNQEGKRGLGHTSGVVLPKKVVEGVKAGRNLADVLDEMFGTENIGQGIGVIGLLSKGVINRGDYTTHAIALALAPFLYPDLEF